MFVFDVIDRYRPRFGYGSAANDEPAIIELPDQVDPFEDQFEKRALAKVRPPCAVRMWLLSVDTDILHTPDSHFLRDCSWAYINEYSLCVCVCVCVCVVHLAQILFIFSRSSIYSMFAAQTERVQKNQKQRLRNLADARKTAENAPMFKDRAAVKGALKEAFAITKVCCRCCHS